jgi:hypothetical protein
MPLLTADTHAVYHAWRWCGGWLPERMPLYLALHPVDDPLLLWELLQYVRDQLTSKQHDK